MYPGLVFRKSAKQVRGSKSNGILASQSHADEMKYASRFATKNHVPVATKIPSAPLASIIVLATLKGFPRSENNTILGFGPSQAEMNLKTVAFTS